MITSYTDVACLSAVITLYTLQYAHFVCFLLQKLLISQYIGLDLMLWIIVISLVIISHTIDWEISIITGSTVYFQCFEIVS